MNHFKNGSPKKRHRPKQSEVSELGYDLEGLSLLADQDEDNQDSYVRHSDSFHADSYAGHSHLLHPLYNAHSTLTLEFHDHDDVFLEHLWKYAPVYITLAETTTESPVDITLDVTRSVTR